MAEQPAQSSAIFEIVPKGTLPFGTVFRPVTRPGQLVIQAEERIGSQGHLTKELCDELNLATAAAIERKWSMAADDSAASPKSTPEEPTVGYRTVSGDQLPAGVLCLPLEDEGRFIWLIHEDHMTRAFAEELTAYVIYLVGNRIWVQTWGDTEAPPQRSAS